jgi:hypothetical protein
LRAVVVITSSYRKTAAFIIACYLLLVPVPISAHDGVGAGFISYSALLRESATKAKKGDEVAEALSIIAAGSSIVSPSETAERIKQNLPPIALKGTVRVPEEVLRAIVREGDDYRDLRETLQPLLRFFDLEGRVLPVLFRSEQPIIGSSAPNGLIISTRAQALLSREELQAVVAHELAHLLVVDVFRAAVDAKDYRTLRVIELFCDAAAAAIMKAMGRNPQSVINGLLKIQQVLELEFQEPDAEGKHPSMNTRIRLSREIIRRFTQGREARL